MRATMGNHSASDLQEAPVLPPKAIPAVELPLIARIAFLRALLAITISEIRKVFPEVRQGLAVLPILGPGLFAELACSFPKGIWKWDDLVNQIEINVVEPDQCSHLLVVTAD